MKHYDATTRREVAALFNVFIFNARTPTTSKMNGHPCDGCGVELPPRRTGRCFKCRDRETRRVCGDSED